LEKDDMKLGRHEMENRRRAGGFDARLGAPEGLAAAETTVDQIAALSNGFLAGVILRAGG
jgi:hypothetical protein